MKLDDYRKKLERIDKKIILLLSERSDVSKAIGSLKFKNKTEIEQEEYWKISSAKRDELISETGLDRKMVENIFKIIRRQSIKIQKESIKKLKNAGK